MADRDRPPRIRGRSVPGHTSARAVARAPCGRGFRGRRQRDVADDDETASVASQPSRELDRIRRSPARADEHGVEPELLAVLADGRLERRVVAHKGRRSRLCRESHCRRVDVDPDAVAAGREKDPERKLTDEAETDDSDALTHDGFALANAVKRNCANRCVCSLFEGDALRGCARRASLEPRPSPRG